MTWAQSKDLEELSIFARGTRVAKAHWKALCPDMSTFGNQRFESMGNVWVAMKSGSDGLVALLATAGLQPAVLSHACTCCTTKIFTRSTRCGAAGTRSRGCQLQPRARLPAVLQVLDFCADRDGVPRYLFAAAGASGAVQKGHSRVRGFGGVATFPVVNGAAP